MFLLALGSLFGCGGGETGSPGGSEPGTSRDTTESAEIPDLDVCELVTPSDVEAAMGTSFGRGERSDSPPMFTCSYGDTDVQISVMVYPDAADAEAAYDMGTNTKDSNLIEGLGDAAHSAEPLGEIRVLKDRYELSVDLFTSMDEERELEIAKALAVKLVARLD